jgi:hypothetical protein
MTAPRRFTAEDVRSAIDYDPEAGVFRWKHRADRSTRWNGRYAGKVAGRAWSPKPGSFYWVIRLNDWPLLGHTAAWLFMTGEYPAFVVDHKDLDGLNNRWDNLRAATYRQNNYNRRPARNNTSGAKGVCYCRRKNRYRAYITEGGRQKYLGYFLTVEEAAQAYARAASVVAGEFARGAA